MHQAISDSSASPLAAAACRQDRAEPEQLGDRATRRGRNDCHRRGSSGTGCERLSENVNTHDSQPNLS